MKDGGIRFARAVGIAISGGCVGFLTGLSVSPVAGVVLTSVVAVVVALVSTLAGLSGSSPSPNHEEPNSARHETRGAVSALPVTALLLGIVAGVIPGIWTRTHNWLGVSEKTTGLGEHEGAASLGVLYSTETSQCNDLRGIADENALRESMSHTFRDNSSVVSVIRGCKDLSCLKGLLEIKCGK